MEFIKLDEAVDLINKMLWTISKLNKFKAHLYNWYNTKTLEPLYPRYISTVDNGNFIGYLFTTKQFLLELIENKENKKTNQAKQINDDLINQMISTIDNIIKQTDFSLLYDNKKHLFFIIYKKINPKLYILKIKF